MIPAFRNCSTSPEPGCTTTATVSATSATSVSDCPTPTVSITTTSNAAASACAAARVAGASPPSRPPGGRRADEDAAVGGIGVDPRAVAEQRAAGALGGRVDREHRDGAPRRPPGGHERGQQRRLAGAGRPGDADDVRRGLAAERGRGDLGEQRRDLGAVAGRPALDEVQDRGRRAEVAVAQAAAQLGAGLVTGLAARALPASRLRFRVAAETAPPVGHVSRRVP